MVFALKCGLTGSGGGGWGFKTYNVMVMVQRKEAGGWRKKKGENGGIVYFFKVEVMDKFESS